MRALTAPLSLHAASSPIETIMFFFAVATLAYSHVLSAIKYSQFLAPTAPSTLRPALALLRDNEWVGVNENNWFEREGVTALEIQQLMLSMEPKAARKLSDSLLQDLFENATGFFTHQFLAASGKPYSDICFRPVSEEPSCFVASPSDSNVITLSFTPGTTDDLVTALKRPGLKDGAMNFVLETPESQSLSDMKNGRRVAYAAYTMVSCFWDLAKIRKADLLDILLVLAGYILMHATFIKLSLASRSLGSIFWLMTGILFSSVPSFILALPIASYFSIPLEPVSLIEAHPFLVCTVGFDKPLRLARSVFTHPHLFQPAVTTGVSHIKMFRTLSQSKDTASSLAASKLVNGELPRQRTSLAELVLGVKGPFLRQPQGVVAKNSRSEKDDKKAQDNKEESPVARMKLFLIVLFLTLHILNMVTTLNPAQPSFSTELAPGVSRKVDITSPAISSVLASLADVHSMAATETELLVQVAPPVHIRMVPLVSATASHPSHKSSPSGSTGHHQADSDDVLESFMSSWTRLVGDPVMSKWIVLVLGVSVALNGYLLKGIATSTGSARSVTPPQSVRFTTTPSVSSGPSQPKGRDLATVSAVPSSATVDLAALKGAEEAKARAERETAKEMGGVMGMPTPPAEKEGSPLVQQKPLPHKASVTGISSMLQSVDQKLRRDVEVFPRDGRPRAFGQLLHG